MSAYKELLAIAESQTQLEKLADWFHRRVLVFEAAHMISADRATPQRIEANIVELRQRVANAAANRAGIKISDVTFENGAPCSRITARILMVLE